MGGTAGAAADSWRNGHCHGLLLAERALPRPRVGYGLWAHARPRFYSQGGNGAAGELGRGSSAIRICSQERVLAAVEGLELA